MSDYTEYHESERELSVAKAIGALPERCRECKYLDTYWGCCEYGDEDDCFYDERHYCSDCQYCHQYGDSYELYCDYKETMVDEIDSCIEFEKKGDDGK